jgi:hypothetical protein
VPPFQLTWVRLVGLLVAVALVAILATAGTGFGLLYYLAQRPAPTTAPAYRAPIYQQPAQAPAPGLPKNTGPGADPQQIAKDACDKQWRSYQQQYNEYLAQKTSGGRSLTLEPAKPWC